MVARYSQASRKMQRIEKLTNRSPKSKTTSTGVDAKSAKKRLVS